MANRGKIVWCCGMNNNFSTFDSTIVFFREVQLLSNMFDRRLISSFPQRTKPKGMMDLSFSMVYEVHQSFFGR